LISLIKGATEMIFNEDLTNDSHNIDFDRAHLPQNRANTWRIFAEKIYHRLTETNLKMIKIDSIQGIDTSENIKFLDLAKKIEEK